MAGHGPIRPRIIPGSPHIHVQSNIAGHDPFNAVEQVLQRLGPPFPQLRVPSINLTVFPRPVRFPRELLIRSQVILPKRVVVEHELGQGNAIGVVAVRNGFRQLHNPIPHRPIADSGHRSELIGTLSTGINPS